MQFWWITAKYIAVARQHLRIKYKMLEQQTCYNSTQQKNKRACVQQLYIFGLRVQKTIRFQVYRVWNQQEQSVRENNSDFEKCWTFTISYSNILQIKFY